jgi:hypothetical protein
VSVATVLADDPTDLDEVKEWFPVALEALKPRMKVGTFYGGHLMCERAAELTGISGPIEKMEKDASKGGFRGDGWSERYMYRTQWPTVAQWAREIPTDTPIGTRFLIHGTGHAGAALVTEDGLTVFNIGARHRVDAVMEIRP